jgi:hypothetical protein
MGSDMSITIVETTSCHFVRMLFLLNPDCSVNNSALTADIIIL